MDTGVALVKAYLELAGYFVLAELPVREAGPDAARDLTDLDVVAVRFPHVPAGHGGAADRPLAVFLGADPVLATDGEAVEVVVGEVKEGQARLNPALGRAEAVAFALRRVGCCPLEAVEAEAARIARTGERELAMPGGVRCRVRLVAFGGHGRAAEPGVHTVPLARCERFVTTRLREYRDVLAGVHFSDPVLGLLALREKLATRSQTSAR